MLLHGTEDLIVPLDSARQLSTQLAQCELHELPGLGHVPIVTAPADMAARINIFGQHLTPADTAPRLMY